MKYILKYIFDCHSDALKQVNFEMLGNSQAQTSFAKKVCTNKLKIKIQVLVPSTTANERHSYEPQLRTSFLSR